MTPEPTGTLDQKINGRQIADDHIEVEVERLFDHLRRDKDRIAVSKEQLLEMH